MEQREDKQQNGAQRPEIPPLLSVDTFAFLVGFCVLILAYLWAGLWEWSVFWVGVCVWLGALEYYCEKKMGLTLSERFGKLRAERPAQAYALLALFWFFVIALTWHLLSMR